MISSSLDLAADLGLCSGLTVWPRTSLRPITDLSMGFSWDGSDLRVHCRVTPGRAPAARSTRFSRGCCRATDTPGSGGFGSVGVLRILPPAGRLRPQAVRGGRTSPLGPPPWPVVWGRIGTSMNPPSLEGTTMTPTTSLHSFLRALSGRSCRPASHPDAVPEAGLNLPRRIDDPASAARVARDLLRSRREDVTLAL
jgi:hypothetical protein